MIHRSVLECINTYTWKENFESIIFMYKIFYENFISIYQLTHKAIQSNTENWKCKSIKFMLDLETTKGINQINANLK